MLVISHTLSTLIISPTLTHCKQLPFIFGDSLLSGSLNIFNMHRIIFLAQNNICPASPFWNIHNSLVFRTKTVESAKAEGEKIRLIGGAEARAVEAVGRWAEDLNYERIFILTILTILTNQGRGWADADEGLRLQAIRGRGHPLLGAGGLATGEPVMFALVWVKTSNEQTWLSQELLTFPKYQARQTISIIFIDACWPLIGISGSE